MDSAKRVIDSVTFSNIFTFFNSPTGSYYLVAKHYQCIETWSKAGVEPLLSDGSVYNYDFTASASQAYGNNEKLKGSKYCMYSGDIDQSGFIDLSDIILVYNDSKNFVTGNVKTDLNGDNIVDLSDLIIVFNNSSNFIGVIRP